MVFVNITLSYVLNLQGRMCLEQMSRCSTFQGLSVAFLSNIFISLSLLLFSIFV